MATIRIIAFLAAVIANCTAFTNIAPSQRATLQTSKEDTLFNTKRMLLPEASSSILTAVEILPGSTIVDPASLSHASNSLLTEASGSILTAIDLLRVGSSSIVDPVSVSHVSNSLLTAVEVFDGSTIVDPVVVSDVFWNSLRSKFLALVIGQVLSAIVFAAISSFFAAQISQVGTFVKEKIFPEDPNKPKKTAQAASNSPAQQQQQVDADFGKLLVCLAIDFFGVASEAVPVLGELADVVYAPAAAALLRSLYGGSNVLFGLEFAEEILPLTDIIPLATIAWVVETYFANSELAKILSVGNYNQSRISAPDAIDTTATTDSDTRRLPDDKSRWQ
ncbi:unnamed protein product [Cylindrotheca closterium]|uniref:Uncharacterized protein n=1 Tax=Cylindrotheca closterium TaxID=2856 RepID=A0AAD2GD55_9STRA|nr:unnamed protein product [Cylindrotheca closterium]